MHRCIERKKAKKKLFNYDFDLKSRKRENQRAYLQEKKPSLTAAPKTSGRSPPFNIKF
jgi:hypothetical protein